MVGSRSAWVVDTNVLIDLHAGEVLEATLRLPYNWLIPDVLTYELTKTTSIGIACFIDAGLIQEKELDPAQVAEVSRLRMHYPRPSVSDLFALVLAKSLGIGLLTGDRALRSSAEAEGVAHHGILWLLDQVVDHQMLTIHEAAAALQRMLNAGARLPTGEVESRLRAWLRE
jgi:predicted nucleic acid-binding protein